MPRGIFRGLFDQDVHFRDSRHAAEAFSFNKPDLSNGTPRHKFEFFLRINFNTSPDVAVFVRNFLNILDQDMVTTMVKNVTMPSMSMDTEVLNQYNKKRISQTRLNFNPVTITFHDSVEGRMLRLWEMYYEYYFRDGQATEKLDLNSKGRRRNNKEFDNDVIKDRFNDNFGYNLARVGNNKYLIDSIEIFQIHGGRFSRTEIVHPRITSFNHDTLDYEDSVGLVEMKFEFMYEDVVYANVNERMNNEELERFRNGDFWQMANLITIRTPVRGRNVKANAPLPNVDGNTLDFASFGQGKFLSSPIGSAIVNVVGERNVQLVQDTIGGIVGSIPDAIGTAVSASIFGGSVEFNPDPRYLLRSTGNQVSRNIFNRARDGFSSTVSGGVSTVISGITPGDDGDN